MKKLFLKGIISNIFSVHKNMLLSHIKEKIANSKGIFINLELSIFSDLDIYAKFIGGSPNLPEYEAENKNQCFKWLHHASCFPQ